MASFTPFVIEHLQLAQVQDFKFTGKKSLLFIWQNNVPLGHVWLKTEAEKFSVKSKLVEAISPAVYYYLWQKAASREWEDFLKQGSFFKLAGVLAAQFKNLQQKLQVGKKESTLSIVICTRNRPAAIVHCITSIMNCSDKDFELVIVDNAPDDDRTKEAVQKFSNVTYVREDRKGLDIARNTGARTAKGDIIAYTDDDVIVSRDWIKNLKKSFDDPLTMSVTGQVFPVEIKTDSQYTFERYWGFNKGYCPKTFDHKYFLDNVEYGVPVWDIGAGANMAFRREIFDLVGWFDERLDVGASGCSGDSEFWYKILAEGWNCQYNPSLFVYHQHRETKKDLDKQIFCYMRGQVSSLMVQHEKYGHKGNITRVKKLLPDYYRKKITREIRNPYGLLTGTTLTEIRGSISGYRFYQEHKDAKAVEPPLQIPESLRREVTVTESSQVSVVIPCYNHALYLSQAIESVLSQTWKNIQIIVVDDGSTDNTKAVADKYGVTYVRVERVGLSAARNIGVQFSTGSFVLFLDADDMLYPNAVELNLSYFSIFKTVAFVSGAHDKIDEYGNVLPGAEPVQKKDNHYHDLLLGNYIAMEGTVLYRRNLFFTFHFDPKLKACEDYDLNLRIARHLPVFSHTTRIAAYRFHDNNMSSNEKLMFEQVVKVLNNQKSLLRTTEEHTAFARGLENWKKYYSISANKKPTQQPKPVYND